MCVHMYEYTDIHMYVYMCVYAHTRVQTSPHPQKHEGRLTLCLTLPVCQQVALSVPRGSHTASVGPFGNSAVMPSPEPLQWKSDSQHLSQPEPAFAAQSVVRQTGTGVFSAG